MMLGYLLARAGIVVAILEKHQDFLRDFRGDTVHPSTLQVLHELGLLQSLLARPHQEVTKLRGEIDGHEVVIADFSHLSTICRFVALMPQWDFLDFLAEQGRQYPGWRLMMESEVTDVLERDGRIAGVRAKTPDGTMEIYANLLIGADGRHSIVRQRAQLPVDDLGAPIDVLWMRLPRQPNDPSQIFGYAAGGKLFVMLDRDSYWQCAYVIPKGSFAQVQQRGLDTFRKSIAEVVPFLRDRVSVLSTWENVKLLSVSVDRLRLWYRPGLLCIGDAAHAMSPVGGVGINLAIQDAVAAANALVPAFAKGNPSIRTLARVQHRREWPTRMTQRMQVFLHEHVIFQTLEHSAPRALPWPLRWLQRWPVLRRIPARLGGVGFRPEHVRTPAIQGRVRVKRELQHVG